MHDPLPRFLASPRSRTNTASSRGRSRTLRSYLRWLITGAQPRSVSRSPQREYRPEWTRYVPWQDRLAEALR
jgi:hypothetical protein